MAIELLKEKNCELTAQDRYSIISYAIQAAYDNGFMNAFVFERALYCLAFAVLDTDDLEIRQEYFIKIAENPLVFWQNNLDVIDEMCGNHQETLNILGEEAYAWFSDYTEYAYSMRGLLDNLGDLMNGVTQRAEEELAAMYENDELKSVIGIAEEWGMNRETPVAAVQEETETKVIDGESLFE